MNLLIVDDETLEREVLRDIVKKSNLNIGICLEAANGLTALEITKKNKIDLILMDIKMPILDGLSAAKMVKQIDPNIKIIFLTAYNEFDFALQTIKIGAEDFLLKPVRPKEVVESLQKVVTSAGNNGLLEEQRSSVIEKINSYIKSNIDEKLTLEQLARVVHLHPQYISRLFKQEMGMTFTDFITKKRIEKSKELLVKSKKNITEISELCGFSDPNYFSRVFRKMEGEPPMQYRKNETLLRKEKLNKHYFNRIM
ncbi:response regulator [Thalassobacillus sp. C254]|uniref:response regulator transcription factor n=1 Tax=Thalassobacillus sp. C254 TaxID=1225341 RepID=UPI0006CFAD6F|nr:response regulator [Thalassobacillus sp. C254]